MQASHVAPISVRSLSTTRRLSPSSPPICRATARCQRTRDSLPPDAHFEMRRRQAPSLSRAGSPAAAGCSDKQTRRSAERASTEVREGAMCVQRLDDSLNSAIRTTYRSSLRSSSKHEPRGPPLEVVLISQQQHTTVLTNSTLRQTTAAPRHDCRAASHRVARSTPNNHGGEKLATRFSSTADADPVHKTRQRTTSVRLLYMILPQVHLRKPCYDFYFL